MAAVVAGVVAAARVEVAAVVVVTMAVVLVRPLTLYKPSATVLFHFVLKLIFSENKTRPDTRPGISHVRLGRGYK